MSENMENRPAKLAHVGIEVSNIGRSREFYEALARAIGLKTLYESQETIGWGNGEFNIWVIVSKDCRITRRPPEGNEAVVADHTAIHLNRKEDVDAADRTMRKAGYPPLFSPEEHPEFTTGYYSAVYCDPDNYVIELFTVPRP
jgi:catechol 2,3-dioxygenase-like lactoylglutathione lyase family enzyme